MTVTIKKILLGATVAASMAAFASTPAFATKLTKPTNIQFITNGVKNTDANKANINTWTYGSAESDKTGIGGVNRQVLNNYNNKGNINKAIAALTDNDSATNSDCFTTQADEKPIDFMPAYAKFNQFIWASFQQLN